MPTAVTSGLHVMGEITTAAKEPMLTNRSEVEQKTRELIQAHGLTIVGETGFTFEGGGFTTLFALAESHLSLHTWPELNYVTLDVFVCNVSRNNSTQARALFGAVAQLFTPTHTTCHEMVR